MDGRMSPGEMDDTGFQRLPEYIQHVSAKLGQLVQEEHAVVRETDLAGPDRSPPPPTRPASLTV